LPRLVFDADIGPLAIRKKCGVALLLVSMWPMAARAQAVDDATRQAARNLGMSGVEAYQAQDYTTASAKLEKAYRALKVPSLGLWSARALVKVDKLIEAGERYQEVQRLDSAGGDRAVQEQARADAAKELEQLSPQIPNLVIAIAGADAERTRITIDGVALNTALVGEKRPVNPGQHRIEASSGAEAVSGAIQLALGQTKTFTIRFGAAPAGGEPHAPPVSQATDTAEASKPASATGSNHSGRRTVGFVTIAVGGAGLVLGGITGAMAMAKKNEIDDNPRCKNNLCERTEWSLVESYSSLRTMSSIGFIAGAVVLTGGVVLLLTAPNDPEQTALTIGPGSLGLSRSF
jgi:hypothetical protein